MKIIISEEQTSGAMEKLLKMKNIEYEIEYDERKQDVGGRFYDGVNVWFTVDGRKFKLPFRYWYVVRGVDNIGKLDYYDDVRTIDEFSFLPKDIVNGYFIKKTRQFLEDMYEERRRNPKWWVTDDNINEGVLGDFLKLFSRGTKETKPILSYVNTLKPIYIKRFGKESYDKLVQSFLSKKIDRKKFLSSLESSKTAKPNMANFVSKFGVKFTKDEISQIHKITSQVKNIPSSATKALTLRKYIKPLRHSVKVTTKTGVKNVPVLFITSDDAVRWWGENYRSSYGFAVDDYLLFSIDNVKKMSPTDIDQLFYHELAHIKDPSSVSSKLMKKYKSGTKRYSDEYFSNSYYFHPRELVANTSKILNGISTNTKKYMKSLGKEVTIKTLDDIINWGKGVKKDITPNMKKLLGYDEKFVKEHFDILSSKNPTEYKKLLTKIVQQSDYLKSQVKIAL